MEDSFPHAGDKLENDVFVCDGLFNDGSHFMDPGMEFKAELELLESSEGDMKYCFDSDALVSEEDLQISKREVDKNEKSVKTGVKEESDIHLGFSRKEDKGEGRGRGNECPQKEEQMENRCCENPLCQEIDSKTQIDVGTTEKSFVGGNYEKQVSGIVNPNTQMLIHTEDLFRCRESDEIVSNEIDLKVHYEIHNRIKSFKCSVCGKAFHKKSYLATHFRIHTEEKPFKCSVCDKTFHLKSILATHFKIHAGEKPFKCNVCDKAFHLKGNLATHFKTHTGEKPFKCNVCDKVFHLKGNLARHSRIHTGEKLFKCNVCDKAFNFKNNLARHSKIHTGEKPFKCNVCDKAFSERSYLTIHYRIHTGSLKCSVCDKAFSRKSNLLRHHKIHNGF
ncbi:zinc finger protein OZF-like [Palaemon carinicauda]|uniref:zinc finger protein OZF-like n=1 Tax=Palaemon carinicauda TaxID=392227 RepID=UPI0035B65D36